MNLNDTGPVSSMFQLAFAGLIPGSGPLSLSVTGEGVSTEYWLSA